MWFSDEATTQNSDSKVHRRSLAYIRAALSSSSKFEQSDGIDHPFRSRRCGVWKAACSTRTTRESKLLWKPRCVTSSMPLPLEPTCNAAFFFAFGVLWIFFLIAMSIKPWTVYRNSGWVHRNWGPFEEICWAQTTKVGHGGGFRKRERKALCMLTGQPLVRDD